MSDFPIIPILIFAGELVIRIGFAIAILLRRPGDSTSRTAWLIVVLLIPFAGAIAYLLVGEVRLGRKRVRRHGEIVTKHGNRRPDGNMAHAVSISELPAPFGQIASLAESVGGNVPIRGNALQLLGDTDQTVDAMVEDIARARRHVHLLTYIYLCDRTGCRVAEAMMDAEKRGVECRLLVDDVGSRDFLQSSLADDLRSAGVQVTAALPVNPLRALFYRIDLRNHRKITVIDGEIGYTGSQNIADAEFAPKKRYAPWVDAMVRMRGPIVSDLQRLFVEDWFLDTDEWLGDALSIVADPVLDGVTAQVIGTGPNAFNFAMRTVFQAAIHLSREEIILTTPYFVPDDATVSALRTAARRGIDITLVLPRRNDARLVAAASRGFYETLLDSGVRIHEFNPGLLHAKTMTIDRNLAIVSSANLDKRSFYLNFEASVIVYDSDFTSQLRFLQQSYMDRSTPVRADAWMSRMCRCGWSTTLRGCSAPSCSGGSFVLLAEGKWKTCPHGPGTCGILRMALGGRDMRS